MTNQEEEELANHLRENAEEEKLRAVLSPLNDRYFREPKTRRLWPRFVAAAAAIVLLVIAAWQFAAPMGGSPHQRYETFAQHTPLSLTERGNSVSLTAEIEAAYNTGDYPAALPLLRRYLKQSGENEQAKLALGVSLLETNALDSAATVFREIAGGKSALAPYGNWYLALTAVKRGDNEAALKYLDLIPKSETYLTARAKKLRISL